MSSDRYWNSEHVALGDLAAILAAMANTGGGTIYLGVNPAHGRIEGVTNVQQVIDRVFQACLSTEPTLVIPVPRTLRVGEEKVLEISVPQGLPHVYNFEGRYFWREDRHTEPIPEIGRASCRERV